MMRKEKLSKKIKYESGKAPTMCSLLMSFPERLLIMRKVNNRYEFIIVFDVEDRDFHKDIYSEGDIMIDSQRKYSIVMNSYLKRKIRHHVSRIYGEKELCKIFFKRDKPLSQKCKEAYEACGLKTGEKRKNRAVVSVANDYMCKNYYDVRTFGAVMDDRENPCGSVHGPVQIVIAQSEDPVLLQEIKSPWEFMNADKIDVEEMKIDQQVDVHYALYQAHGFVTPSAAKKTNFSEEDLEILWEAIIHMFDFDGVENGKFRVRKLIIFKHSTPLGDTPASALFHKVIVKKKDGVEVPCRFSDYTITIKDIPDSIEVIEKL